MKGIATAAIFALLSVGGAALAAPALEGVPRYDHIFIIIGENKSYQRIMAHPEWAPNLNRLAAQYGSAIRFYAEVHPSEGNYVAMLGGDTFGIHDDDAFYCKPHMKDRFCAKSSRPDYADHSIAAPSLMDQLSEHHLTWKGYFEDLPMAGSLSPFWPTPLYSAQGEPFDLYAAKHNGFLNFASVNEAPERERTAHLVNFNQLSADLTSGRVPNFAEIVPNQCNDMHGLSGANVPEDCRSREGLIRRGDAEFGQLVARIMQSSVWSRGNSAIVITFDEDDGTGLGAQGCCGYDPSSSANSGGGQIMTLVITNHGPRHLADPTPYNHYSLLRTVEDAFGIGDHLGHAADTEKGVVALAPLFTLQGPKP